MSGKKSRGEKSVLSRQDVTNRKRAGGGKNESMETSGVGAVAGVLLAATALFSLVALSSFQPKTANAAGPVGHALADGLSGALGLGAYALPLAGLYGAFVFWVGRRNPHRFRQLVAGLAMFLSLLAILHLVRAPQNPLRLAAGSVGSALAETLRAFFSTVGTWIVVVTVALASFIIATEQTALRTARALAAGVTHVGRRLGSMTVAGALGVKAWWTARREAAAKERLENAAFIAQLEADQEEQAQNEREAQEADEVAEEAFRLNKEAEKEAEKAKPKTKPAVAVEGAEKPSGDPAWAMFPDAPSQAGVPTAPPRKREKKAALAIEPFPEAAAATAPATLAPPASAMARTPVIVEPKAPPKPTAKKEERSFEFVGGRTSFTLPPLDVLESDKRERTQLDKDAFLSTAEKLRSKLADFGITGEVVEIRPGPVVTMYEFLPGPGIKVSKIASLADDLAMAMEAMRVRIVAPIPGKGVVGIEVPNRDRETVYLKEIAEQDAFAKSSSKLTMCLGKDIEGMPYVMDLAKAPHLLIAGTTGSGKSVAVNSMIMSLLLKSTPEEVRFIMVDPKRLELSVYEGIPHLLLPVVTDPKKAALALRWAVEEMERRYHLLSEVGVRNITGYNKWVESVDGDKKALIAASKKSAAPAKAPLIVDVEANESEESALERRRNSSAELPLLGVPAPADDGEVRTPLEGDLTEAAVALPVAEEPKKELQKLPYIVVIIDELADLMMVASREVETYVARLAQMARAAGIHLMVATQRPSTDVVTGVIKANFPTRITFMLRSKPDSMTILGTVGAESLLGMGDMLLMPPTSAHLVRVHGAFVSENEIKRAVDHLKAQGKPVYDDSILKPRDEDVESGGEDDELSDELYDQALATVSQMEQVSISMLQRKMRIGYNRAARMIERMERDGVVGPADGAKPREVLLRAVGEMPGAGAM